MGVESKHPLYSEQLDDWTQLRDTYGGERGVKTKGRQYLPATSGMFADGLEHAAQPGYQAYVAYRTRARFPNFVKAAVEANIGVMHNKPPVFELPKAMEPLLERSTVRNESLEMLLRRINEEQLVTGRVGLLLEVVPGTVQKLPYIALYKAEDIVNWDEGISDVPSLDSLSLVSLNESQFERNLDFQWNRVEKYRVLILGELAPPLKDEVLPANRTYRVGVVRKQEPATLDENAFVTPSIAGRELDRIPFVFINTRDIVPAPDSPPLLDLSNLCLTIYRGEADYRQSLFMQGQSTLVVVGGEDGAVYRTGANAAIAVPVSGDAKYIGVESNGLPEQRLALENDYAAARQRSGQLIDETSREKESGEALRVRVAGKTATLKQIALAGAFGLQEVLRILAVWIGANPAEVVVTPNLDFVDDKMAPKDLLDTMSAKALGAPISLQSIHASMQQKGATEMTWEEELAAIEEEKDLELLPPPSTNPDGPADNPDAVPDEAAEPAGAT